MIQEPARVQATTYADQEKDVTTSGERIYSSNCNCSRMRTEQTAPTKDLPQSTPTTTSTTIPIVINTHPNPRIILIKVPTHSNSSNNSNNNNKSNRPEPTAPRTRLIRIPFLPGSVPTPSSVKRALPTASSLVSFTTSGTASRIATQTLSATGIIYPPEKCSSSSYSLLNQVTSGQAIGPPTLSKTAETTVTQTVQVSSMPKTLASMAGIQLTGVDMESHQDMSGAMPTATVEEIDVPVFIDEYLQNIEASSSTSSSNKSEENGKEICSETDIFDFDFDINLIAEDLIERKEMDQCSQNMDIIYSDNINNDLDMDELQFSQLLDEGGEEAIDVGTMGNGIDINPQMDSDLSNLLIGEQNPMLSNYSQGSLLSSSQTKFINELPMLADENSMETNYYGSSQASLGFGISLLDLPSEGVGLVCQDVSSTSCVGVKRTASMAGLVPIAESMPQKRNNLMLNINKSLIYQPDNINTPEIIEQVLNLDEQNSATNIATQDSIYEDLRSTEENTAFTVFQDFSAPNTPYSAYSVSTSTSTSNAPTCHTGFGGLITAPGSPALSTASTSQFSASATSSSGTKRKRGRPAKEHADGPDPELMSQMTGEELKQYQDRIKNNEASRVSRRKTKNREDAEKLEEDELLAKFKELSAILQRISGDRKLLEDHLMQKHHRNSTYVKPEPEH
ncbi:serine-rich adhesin for platelets [Drosophila innubila]|uniref:serine-rich adhesin for platelets n=1 Tax=Drosophila innubila TaxID=198719 RepID=UPI00148E2A37|nr:serine-rich adhesin for platelets [Drosophila innubila]